jgi:prepilin-type N-terminal cleavage/methylation domain-containing protein
MDRQHARGLTLIEILMTIAVLSLAVAMAIPSMSQTGVLRVQAAVRTIASDVALAQTEAMAYQSRRAVYFGAVVDDPATPTFRAGNGYAVVEPTGTSLELGTLGQYALTLPENQNRPFSRDFASRDVFGGAEVVNPDFDGDAVLIFDELGGPLRDLTGPDPSVGGAVEVRAPDLDLLYRLTIQPMTGQLRVERVTP